MPFRDLFHLSSTTPSPKPHPMPITTNTSSIQPSTPQAPQNTTLIELFQSQGCDSCPPANSACIALADTNDPTFLLLTYEVTYWDHLGWRDTFGDSRWDARQRDYAAALGQRSVYTPQVLVDGGAQPVGTSWRNIPAMLAKHDRRATALAFELVEGGTQLRVAGEGEGIVLAVFYEAAPAPVRILRGENRGATLPHRNVVREMEVVGRWEGGAKGFEVPRRRPGLEMAILVQAGRGGPILGATRM